MSERTGPKLALAVVRLSSRLVPRWRREAWRREWEGELLARWEELAARGSLGPGARLDLLGRALGSVVDAVSYGDGRWKMSGWGHDLRIATRALWRRPGYSAVIISTFAVGIGANTALFSVARDVLLRPFPYPDADRVVAVESYDMEDVRPGGNVTYPNITDIGRSSESFEAIAVARWWQPALEEEGGSIVLRGATVTANYFGVLGVQAGQGRFFRPDEEGEGRPDQVVLSHSVWRDRFGADPQVVGRDLTLSGTSHRVIGVTSSDFEDPWLMDSPGSEPQIWQTVATPPSEWPRSGRSWKGIGRIRPEVSLDVAQAEVSAIMAGLAEQYPEHNANRGMRITPLLERVAGPVGTAVYTLLGAVGLLLLIACANLANLMLGRALDRHSELALHRALGAPGWRILNRGLAEAGILAGIGGVAGVGLAALLGGYVTRLGPTLPRPVTGEVDGGVLLFALAVTVGAGLASGLLPAAHAARASDALPGDGNARGRTLGRSGQRLRRALVVSELALTATLLVGAGLLLRSFERLGAVDLGVEPESVVGVHLHGAAWWGLEAAEAQALWDDVLEAVREVPGVQGAGALDYLPFGGDYSCDGVYREDLPRPGPGEGRCAETRVVLPGAIEALGIPLVRGRLIDERDGPDAPGVVVIDENMAEAFWPGADPIGSSIQVHTRSHEVVGVVRNLRHFGPEGEVRPQLYLHAPQEGWNGIARGLTLVARGQEAAALATPIRRAVADVSGSIAVGQVTTLDELLSANTAARRFRTLLMTAFGFVALLLAALGIAGVMSYSVARRKKELGVRLALGAKPRQVRGLVLREGARLVIQGVALGMIGAWAVAGALRSLLFEVNARDPIVFGLASALLIGCAAAACYLPARRASRVDPSSALAAE